MTRRFWRRIVFLIALVILLAGSLPFLISANRFRARLIARLESSLGRKVEVGAVRFSLLGAPALEAEYVTVAEDPRFGNEPFLRAPALRCTIRPLSILQRRLELSSLSFSNPSINLVRNGQGEWNLSSLLERRGPHTSLVRNGQPPERSAGSPAGITLDLDAARINFKSGPNKLVHTLDNLSAKLRYSPENHRWELEAEFTPQRTDMSLAEIGTIALRAKGELKASHWRDWPLQFQAEWKKSRLSDIARLFFGQDKGWRGLPQIHATGNGSLRRLDFQAAAQLSDLHAAELLSGPDTPILQLQASGSLDLAGGEFALHPLAFRTERSKGILSARTGWSEMYRRSGRPAWEVQFDSDQMDLADFAAWLPGLRANVDATMKTDAVARVHLRASGVPTTLEGTVSVPPSNLETSSFDLAGNSSLMKLRVGEVKAQFAAGSLRISPIVLRWPEAKGELKLRGNVNFRDSYRPYRLEVTSDQVPIEGVTALEQALGIVPPRPFWLVGAAAVSLRWRGQLRGPGPPSKTEAWPEGKLLLDGIRVFAPGMRGDVEIRTGYAELRAGEMRVFLGATRFAGTNWQGRLHLYAQPKRQWHFTLSTERLNLAALDEIFNPRYSDRSFLRPARTGPFAQFLAKPGARWFDSVRATGKLSVGSLEVGVVKTEDLRATADLSGGQIRLDNLTMRAYSGQFEGWFRADFRPAPSGPSYHMQGKFDHVLAESLLVRPGSEEEAASLPRKERRSPASPAIGGARPPVAQLADSGSLLAGLLDGTLTLKTSGITRRGLVDELTGSVQLNWNDGRVTHFDLRRAMEAATKPGSSREAGRALGFTAFRSATARFLIADRRFDFQPLTLAVEGEELELTGTVGFDGKLALRIYPKTDIAARAEELREVGRRPATSVSRPATTLPLSPTRIYQLMGTLWEPRLTAVSGLARPGR